MEEKELLPEEINCVIYHHPCPDGMGSAYVAWRYLKHKSNVEYIGASYYGPPDVTGKNVLLCDISYRKSIILDMIQKANNQNMVDTDKAWKMMYTRLENDGLIEKHITPQERSMIPVIPLWMKWAASFLVLITTGLFLFSTLTTDNKYQTLTNSENNTMIQVLQDGSIVYLAEHSTLTFPSRFNRKQRTVTLQGQAFFDIQYNPDKPFTVETETMKVKVLGTSFNIKSDDTGFFEILVEEGLVEVQKRIPDGQIMKVGSGEHVSVSDNTFHKTISHDMTASSWKTTRMQFKDETLENVLSVISRNYNTNLYLEHANLKSRKLTVTFYNNTLPTIIELICLSMDLEVEEHPDTGILFKPKT